MTHSHNSHKGSPRYKRTRAARCYICGKMFCQAFTLRDNLKHNLDFKARPARKQQVRKEIIEGLLSENLIQTGIKIF